ncbi:hypothetical protein RMSM_03658 [Rhodopirellula maiorica SM1]|uniref:Uncharacterized protein n=1 Tax=Rhodopirellula maiorica SM1 TaxID=1265738 RepID=M5RJQ6_9BACT|nr:hypothetical protein RMSM_03658 [Rhodopirellula maiorica SM1]
MIVVDRSAIRTQFRERGQINDATNTQTALLYPWFSDTHQE